MEKVQKWIKIGTPKILAENHGKRLIDQTFMHPLTKQRIVYTLLDSDVVSAVVFPLTINMEIIAVKQFRHAIEKVIIELPSGNCDDLKDKNLYETAERELMEETGYKAERVVQLTPAVLWPDPGSNTPVLCPFLAVDCEKTNEPKAATEETEENEDIDTMVIPLKLWLEMIISGEIPDLKTLAITMLAINHPLVALRRLNNGY